MPLIGIPCCRRVLNEFPFHVAGEKYITAVLGLVGGLPLLIPALGDGPALADLVARLDGLLLTGSPSNVEPHHYDGPSPPADNPTDPARDATTLPLIRAAVAAGVPVLGICRGLQELNVALGGTLHQQVHAVPGRLDHRGGTGPVEQRYGPVHSIALTPGGLLADLIGADTAKVNSLHGQGVETLAPGLVIEAVAPDGQIEAFRREDGGFCLGVQWHPEYRASEQPLSVALFTAFGVACRRYAVGRAESGRIG
jgi:putative glutamine amidotransferase